MDFVSAFVISFISIFIIMDPFASLPPFFVFTKKCKENEAKAIANKAIIIAGILAVIFVFGGIYILQALSITLKDFKVAGGIVLVLLGLENVLNFNLSALSKEKGKDKEKSELESAAVLIATPLLTGPGLMSTLIVLTTSNGVLPVLAALVCALFLSWLILYNATLARKVLGDRIIMIISKVIGLLLIAMGIAYIKGGLVP
jgi:multiple antibiotic resistance protein